MNKLLFPIPSIISTVKCWPHAGVMASLSAALNTAIVDFIVIVQFLRPRKWMRYIQFAF